MKNPFDDIQEPDIMPNPGFMCKQYIATHNYIKQYWPKPLCTRQCDECVNEVIEQFISTAIIEPWPMVIKDVRKGALQKLKSQ